MVHRDWTLWTLAPRVRSRIWGMFSTPWTEFTHVAHHPNGSGPQVDHMCPDILLHTLLGHRASWDPHVLRQWSAWNQSGKLQAEQGLHFWCASVTAGLEQTVQPAIPPLEVFLTEWFCRIHPSDGYLKTSIVSAWKAIHQGSLMAPVWRPSEMILVHRPRYFLLQKAFYVGNVSSIAVSKSQRRE